MAELLVFVAQTGMNVAQAHNLRCTQYSYKSMVDGYEVRNYKERRKGEVLFEIFAEYKVIFNAYLEWRKEVFGATTDRLFPFVRTRGLTIRAHLFSSDFEGTSAYHWASHSSVPKNSATHALTGYCDNLAIQNRPQSRRSTPNKPCCVFMKSPVFRWHRLKSSSSGKKTTPG